MQHPCIGRSTPEPHALLPSNACQSELPSVHMQCRSPQSSSMSITDTVMLCRPALSRPNTQNPCADKSSISPGQIIPCTANPKIAGLDPTPTLGSQTPGCKGYSCPVLLPHQDAPCMLVLPTLLAEPCANLHAHLEGDIVGSGQPGQQQQHSMGTGRRALQPSMASMLFLGGFPLRGPCVKVPQQL